MLQDRAFDEIKSSATLSLGRIEHSNVSGCLESSILSFKKQFMGEKMDLHGRPTIRSNRDLDRDFVTILVFCFRHIEYRDNRRGNDEKRSFDKVTSRTDSLANPKD